MTNKRNKQKGFTIFELLLSVAIIASLAAFSVPIFQQLQTERNLDTEMDQAVALMRRAQTLARAGYYDDTWGIRIDSGEIILFKGNNFNNRDEDYDEKVIIQNATPSLNASVIFARGTGAPNLVGSVTYLTTSNYEKTLTLNNYGVLSY